MNFIRFYNLTTHCGGVYNDRNNERWNKTRTKVRFLLIINNVIFI